MVLQRKMVDDVLRTRLGATLNYVSLMRSITSFKALKEYRESGHTRS